MSNNTVDVVLIGGGVMSATLGTLIHQVEPEWSIHILESRDEVATESSNAWNNAGTGHAALCELNYMPEGPDGSLSSAKAIDINEQFQLSRQWWSSMVQDGTLGEPSGFINTVPHMTFVRGEANVDYLRRRFELLKGEPLFSDMEFSDDAMQIAEWAPLLVERRSRDEVFAATRSVSGTDVDFGEVTRRLFDHLVADGAGLHLNHEAKKLHRREDGTWDVRVLDRSRRTTATINARFVFVGAGGGALGLLQSSGIPEIRGFGGFPISGKFLRCDKPEVVRDHHAKVYGKAAVGAPPMSVPHLDTRMIDGKPVLLFGPFATFSTKFLKNGSLWDLPGSVTSGNIGPMFNAGIDNFDLSQYLIGQLMLSQDDRMASLREYFPEARDEDWKLVQAGQRVQIIKKDAEKGGVLQFGTEVVTAADGSVAALLGASPGASTAAPIMLSVLEKAFKDKVATPEWQARLKEIVPSYGRKLNNDIELTNSTRAWSSERLQLIHVPVQPEA